MTPNVPLLHKKKYYDLKFLQRKHLQFYSDSDANSGDDQISFQPNKLVLSIVIT